MAEALHAALTAECQPATPCRNRGVVAFDAEKTHSKLTARDPMTTLKGRDELAMSPTGVWDVGSTRGCSEDESLPVE